MAAGRTMVFAALATVLVIGNAQAETIGPSPSLLEPELMAQAPAGPVVGDLVVTILPPRRPDAETLAASFRQRPAPQVYSEAGVVRVRAVPQDRLFWLTVGNGF